MKSKIVAVALLFALVFIPVFSWLFSMQTMPDQYGHWSIPTAITSMSTACRWLSMSADGNKIVFVSEEDGDAEIFVINSDGAKLMQLTNNTSNDIYPSISGDGKKIAFISHSHDKYNLFVVNSDGTGLKQLMAGERKFALKYISRDDIFALTREASEVSGISYVMDADKEEMDKILGV